MAKLISRRKLMNDGVRISLAGLLVGATSAAAAADKLCADPAAMDSSAKSMRSSLNYVEASPDAGKTCSMCAFFEAPADGCGMCQLLNGPVNSKGHCDSWGAKG
ncbi:MAG: high-potential iron-sulfur protein [Arenimonas sp.]